MAEGARPVAEITSYHAHVYYQPGALRAEAERLRDWIGERFRVRLGRWHDQPIGPHGQAMFQVAFATALVPTLLPWLMLNHGRLSVLVHPNTRNPKRDHVDDAIWIGPPVPLHAEILPEESDAELALEPNTAPSLEP